MNRLPDALRDPAAYPFPVGAVEFLETHISWLFFAGERVFKVKKPLRLEFLDYSTLERRRFFCGEELRLNRRFAGDVYRRVASIRHDAAGSGRLAVDGPGDEVEVAVEMDRLPADRMLDRLLDEGRVDNALLDRLAAAIAAFQRESATGAGVDEFGAPAAVRRIMLANQDELRAFPRLSGAQAAYARATLERFLAEHDGLLRARVAAGRIREGHGDLHAGNVCALDDRIVLYDCIEFSRAFRCIDVAAEIAFLVMDLARRGHHAFGRWLAHRIAEEARDADMARLLPAWAAHYACVRAKVEAIRAGSLAGAAQPDTLDDALAYQALGTSFLLGPFAIFTCGLPATGKSTRARALARRLGAVLVRTDVVRKELAGLAPAARATGAAANALYAADMTERTYAEAARRALEATAAGRACIVDGAFQKRSWRETFAQSCAAAGVPCAGLHVVAPEEVVRRRLEARATDPREVSDAGVAVFEAMHRTFEPPDREPAREPVPWTTAAPDASDAAVLRDVLDLLVARAAPGQGLERSSSTP